ncbi:MAG: type I DNA topoisomerase [Proteobacteria bacterium]|nr:type I DNA topoisomerase [Pseudomonadota bacterium]MDE3208068.1 type I DNA topoisomerase [Pseudomonadota bacterium]
MPTSLLIVESPSKAKTLKKYLGPDFEILASYGHVRDLVPKQGAVDPEQEFAMKYEPISRNSKHFDAIAKAVHGVKNVYLATDPDREGEAIAWHLIEMLHAKKLLNDKNVFRVEFHEITKTAVCNAVENPRTLLMPLVNAQQARRALDYLVGFNLSPLLWKKVRRGLSAGRVQSPALRLIVERELEIEAFVEQEYWSIHLQTIKDGQSFTGRLIQFRGDKLDQFYVENETAYERILTELGKYAPEGVVISKIEKKRKLRHAVAPFTTSTLQQEAVKKLGFTTDRTMRIAQQLYEGVNIAGNAIGLITYMRTDSSNLASEAISEIRSYIGRQFESSYLPSEPNVYKSKSKNAQEAHEAIRPTSVERTPDDVREYLSPEQLKLYEMIWKRTVSSQMSPAQFDTVAVDLSLGDDLAVFRANGQTLIFPGFISVYQEDEEEVSEQADSRNRLPVLIEHETLSVEKLYGEQHFTQPPPRYTEASLVKTLEEYGIGRPSTYAAIISTLINREYVVLDRKRFKPTDVGRVVNRFLSEHFSRYVDYDFTAKMEDELDDVATGKVEWRPVLHEFWEHFNRQLLDKQNIKRQEITQEKLDELCPKCGKPLSIRLGKRDRFVGCTGYPDCNYTRSLNEDAESDPGLDQDKVIEDRSCPTCGGALVVKTGPYGRFIGCANYPKCKFIEALDKPKDSGVTCPVCKSANLIERKSRYGKIFYSCASYPKCKYAVWNLPISEPCPKCGWPILTLKTTKRRGVERVCPQKECGFVESVESQEEAG